MGNSMSSRPHSIWMDFCGTFKHKMKNSTKRNNFFLVGKIKNIKYFSSFKYPKNYYVLSYKNDVVLTLAATKKFFKDSKH